MIWLSAQNDVTIASADGLPIRSVNNILIQPHFSIEQIDQTDLILIASATYIDKILEKNPELVPWIRHQYSQGAHVASICTGVFLLAETGLLDGKSATLHWGFTDIFRKRYPRVTLRQDKMYIDHGRLYCPADQLETKRISTAIHRSSAVLKRPSTPPKQKSSSIPFFDSLSSRFI